MWQRVVQSSAPAAVMLIRLMVGAVLSEGIPKFLFPDQLWAGRFLKIGLPLPELLGPFVGTFEIVCGSLVLLGSDSSRCHSAAGHHGRCHHDNEIADASRKGFWAMAHEARTDWSMSLGALFLLLIGAGPWSVDASFASRR